jgi:CxC6 like cysteine cluster associated with KDZ transposases
VTAAVIDGVAVTPSICAAPGCGGELANATAHRFCVLHFVQHGVCGVVSGPSGEGSCGKSVAGLPLGDWVGERRAPSKVACRGHSFVEAA